MVQEGNRVEMLAEDYDTARGLCRWSQSAAWCKEGSGDLLLPLLTLFSDLGASIRLHNSLWFKSPGVSMKPRKRSLKPVKASNKGDQEFLMQLML